MKQITVDNYLEFKPSTFVRSFLSDLDVAEAITKKTGKKLNMDDWYPSAYCLPCLGGMACLNLGIPPREGIGRYVSDLGNDIRSGFNPKNNLSRLYPDVKEWPDMYFMFIYRTIYSRPTKAELKDLRKRINRLADVLEETGL